MSDGDEPADETDRETEATPEETPAESEDADQPAAEEAGEAESDLGSDESPTADEMADNDGSGDTDEPAGETDDKGRREGDELGAEHADEEATSGDDADIEPPEEDESEPGEEADSGDETTEETEDTADESDGNADDTAEEDENGGADGDDESTDEEDAESDEGEGELEARTPEALDERLDEVETGIEKAETEADLDAVEDDLDDVEEDIEAADLPEPDDDEEDAEDPREELESRVTELREAIDDQRGPYAEDAVEEVEGAQSTLTETRWTEQGEGEVVEVVNTFLDSAGKSLDEEFTAANDDPEQLAAALGEVNETVESRNLDPDNDAETVAALVEAADELTAGLDDAEEWDDLSVREKLTVEGFYDVLEPETRKDFPPEWNAIKIYEKQGDPEPILRGLDMFGSDFMEEHCIESLKRMGAPEAYDVMEQRAQKRNKPPIEVLGKIGDERALETLHEYIEGESDPALQKVTIKAIGEIGSSDSTQPVADRLVADNETVRSNAARALGLIGDTRAVAPLADVLDNDESNSVRASAAWALNQIGTEDALDAAREHADDRSFLVQSEAEKADRAMTEGEDGDDAPQTTA
jgi:hypothetical protein